MFKAIETDLKESFQPDIGCGDIKFKLPVGCDSYGHHILCDQAGLLALHHDEDVEEVSETLKEARQALETEE
jgi:hypothetical protein